MSTDGERNLTAMRDGHDPLNARQGQITSISIPKILSARLYAPHQYEYPSAPKLAWDARLHAILCFEPQARRQLHLHWCEMLKQTHPQ
jgi:hypothetical protein